MSDLTNPITNLGNPIAPGAGVTPDPNAATTYPAASFPTGQDVAPTPPQATQPNPGSNVAPPGAALGDTIGYSTKMTQGWYITIGIVTAMVLGNVPYLGPILFGILGLALLYQISQLVQGQ